MWYDEADIPHDLCSPEYARDRSDSGAVCRGSEQIQEVNMKRKTMCRALAAAAVTLLALHPVTEGMLTAAALQTAHAAAQSGDADTGNWTEDGRQYKVSTKTDPLNMRAEPSQSAMIITTIPRGTTVRVFRICNGWGEVQFGSVVGYCAMEWLTLVTDTATEPVQNPETPSDQNRVNHPEENEQTIFRYLTETLGFSAAAACGVIGNIHVETGGTFDPEAHNPEDTGGTQGYGICQWNSGADAGYRMEELQNYSPAWKTLDCQLDFIRNDLLHNNYLISLHLYEDMKALGNTEEDAVAASDIWAARYEGCAKWTYEMRREKTRLYYSRHCGTAAQWSDVSRTCIIATQSGSLNMRSEPSLFGTILMTIPKDTEVSLTRISEDGTWGRVEYRGVSGYCAMEYLKEKSAEQPAAVNVIRGDLNGNGEVGADDAQIALNAYADRIAGIKMNLTDAQIKAADIDGDGQVSAEDAQLILAYYTAKNVSAINVTWEQLLGK